MKPALSIRIKKNLMSASTRNRGVMLECLLTPTETTMLAKRLAMIVMLERGDSSYHISRSLRVSDSSVQRFRRMLDAGLFKPVVRELRKKNRSLLDVLELILSAGLPSIGGPRSQRRLQKMRDGAI
ncbi:MAG: Trp family transcriptional regulator [Patescibacteria group bacterium]